MNNVFAQGFVSHHQPDAPAKELLLHPAGATG
jgi:hypothetical protein